jgi:amidohydrolase
MKPDLFQARAADLFQQLIAWRRHLHAYPELSFQEHQTAAYIETMLGEMGIASQRMTETGVIATIEGQSSGKKVVALRADMDALPITETNEVSYCSRNTGIMHACGHDVHMACLLGAAWLLKETRAFWQGSVKLIFQPGEEKLPGGASLMIREGALLNPSPQAIVGQHVMPLIETGKVGFRSGVYMASTDEIYLTIHGKGGHGAMPHLNVDPVAIAAQLITSLQQVVSRFANPVTPSVLSFGKVIAHGATNVIPDSVYLEGTFRTMDEHWRSQAHELITDVAHAVCQMYKARCQIEIRKGYPVLKNDPDLTSLAKKAACEYLGADNVVDLDLWMAAEDFAYYSHQIPACFYRLGTGNSGKGITASVHTSTFNIDEEALPIGTGLMAWIAFNYLQTD